MWDSRQAAAWLSSIGTLSDVLPRRSSNVSVWPGSSDRTIAVTSRIDSTGRPSIETTTSPARTPARGRGPCGRDLRHRRAAIVVDAFELGRSVLDDSVRLRARRRPRPRASIGIAYVVPLVPMRASTMPTTAPLSSISAPPAPVLPVAASVSSSPVVVGPSSTATIASVAESVPLLTHDWVPERAGADDPHGRTGIRHVLRRGRRPARRPGQWKASTRSVLRIATDDVRCVLVAVLGQHVDGSRVADEPRRRQQAAGVPDAHARSPARAVDRRVRRRRPARDPCAARSSGAIVVATLPPVGSKLGSRVGRGVTIERADDRQCGHRHERAGGATDQRQHPLARLLRDRRARAPRRRESRRQARQLGRMEPYAVHRIRRRAARPVLVRVPRRGARRHVRRAPYRLECNDGPTPFGRATQRSVPRAGRPNRPCS